MSSHKTILFDFVLRASATQPTTERAKLYRALAAYSGDPSEQEHLLKLAAELEAVDQRCFAFARQLSQRELPFTPPTGGTER